MCKKSIGHKLVFVFLVISLLFCSCSSSVSQTDPSELDTESSEAEMLSNEQETEKQESETQEIERQETTEPETEETDQSKDSETQYFIYDLSRYDEFYYVHPEQNEEGKYLFREDDKYYIVVKEEKIFGSEIILTWQEKALLDAGFVMKVMYREKEIDQIRAEISYEIENGAKEWEVAYNGGGALRCLLSPEHDQLAKEAAGIDLSSPPYNGVGFYLVPNDITPKGFYGFKDNEGGEVRLELSKDMIIDSAWGEQWTAEEFYDKVSFAGFGARFKIYEEQGEIIKIVVDATP